MRRQVLSLLVENTAGVTSHISGLFSRRGYNIDSFSSGVTADPKYTRITIVASGDEQILEQIENATVQARRCFRHQEARTWNFRDKRTYLG